MLGGDLGEVVSLQAKTSLREKFLCIEHTAKGKT